MTVPQLWLVIGFPALVSVAILLVGGSPVRTRIALGVLIALTLVFVVAPGVGRVSATAVGALATLLIAGGRIEGPAVAEHHTTRRRLTTAG
jgi:hypothetical protein